MRNVLWIALVGALLSDATASYAASAGAERLRAERQQSAQVETSAEPEQRSGNQRTAILVGLAVVELAAVFVIGASAGAQASLFDKGMSPP